MARQERMQCTPVASIGAAYDLVIDENRHIDLSGKANCVARYGAPARGLSQTLSSVPVSSTSYPHGITIRIVERLRSRVVGVLTSAATSWQLSIRGLATWLMQLFKARMSQGMALSPAPDISLPKTQERAPTPSTPASEPPWRTTSKTFASSGLTTSPAPN